QRVVILCERAGNKAIIAGIMERRVECPVQPEDSQLSIVFILVAAVLGNLHNHPHILGTVRTGIQIVQSCFHFVIVAALGSSSSRAGSGAAMSTQSTTTAARVTVRAGGGHNASPERCLT